MTEIRITFFKGPATNVTPSCTKRLQFDDFAERLSRPQHGPKDGSYFVRGVCRSDRSNDNMVSAWLAVVDADHGADDGPCPEFGHAVSALESIDYEYCLYTSFSHTPENPRYRILFPLKQSISTPAAVATLYEALLFMLDAEGVCLRPTQESATFSQPWYPPRYQTQKQREAFRFAQGGFKTLVPGEVLPSVKKAPQCRYDKPPVDVRACLEAIRSGADVHNSMNSIIAHLAAHGVHQDVIQALMEAVILNYAPADKTEARTNEIPRSIAGAVSKFGGHNGVRTKQNRRNSRKVLF